MTSCNSFILVLFCFCINNTKILLNLVVKHSGLGGMHLVLFKVEGNNKLPPTTLSPGDMVCVRSCDSRGNAAATSSCIQGFVHNLGEDGRSISVALESRHGDPTFSKLFGNCVGLIALMNWLMLSPTRFNSLVSYIYFFLTFITYL